MKYNKLIKQFIAKLKKNKMLCLITFLIIISFLSFQNTIKPEHIKNGGNICIYMWYDENIKEYADLAKEINKKYCENNNYDFIFDNKRRLKDRHPAWERMPGLINVLENNNYDYVVWIDADAFFRYDHPNQNLLSDIINKNKDKNIIFSYDIPIDKNSEINSGFIIFKNNEFSKKILNEIISNKSDECLSYYNNPNWEQNCVRYIYKNTNELKENSIILPFGELQTFNPNENKNSLIIHLAGTNKEKRINIISDFKNRYNI